MRARRYAASRPSGFLDHTRLASSEHPRGSSTRTARKGVSSGFLACDKCIRYAKRKVVAKAHELSDADARAEVTEAKSRSYRPSSAVVDAIDTPQRVITNETSTMSPFKISPLIRVHITFLLFRSNPCTGQQRATLSVPAVVNGRQSRYIRT